MNETGTIKFQCRWIPSEPLDMEEFEEMTRWRDNLYRLGLIGAYKNGIGFGNLSMRVNETERFIITGTKTGTWPGIQREHFTLVTQYDFDANTLTCRGPIKASSESLTHAAVYQSDGTIRAVIHVHHLAMWRRLINRMPTTSRSAEYGTPQMAHEVMRLFRSTNVKEEKLLVMGGHEEGLLAFGRNLDEAGSVLLDAFES